MEEYYHLETVNLEYFTTCLKTLREAHEKFEPTLEFTIENELYRHALISSFDRLVVLAYRLMKKRITPYFATKKSLDELTYKEVFRTAHKHLLISEQEVNNWFAYRDNRFLDAANYGEKLITETYVLMQSFIDDAQKLKNILESGQSRHE